MLIAPEVILGTMGRVRQSGLDLKALTRPATDGDRSPHVSQRQRESRYATLLAQTGDPAVASRSLERILGGNDLVGIDYLSRGARVARSVCRIRLRNAQGETEGFGTGFLVAPGVLMTNHHVIGGPETAGHAVAEFDFERDIRGNDRPVVSFRILADDCLTSVPLDFCLARVAPESMDGGRSLTDYAWIALDPTPGKAFVGEYLTIIQHPGGERKQVCVRENKLLRFDPHAPMLWYQTDTVAGSSGSPVFNQFWQVVALHHSGVPRTNTQGHWLTVDGKPWDRSMDESRVHWIANEGVRVSSIMAHLASLPASAALAQSVLAAPAPPQPLESTDGAPASGATPSVHDGELRVTIPVHVAVRVGERAGPGALPSPARGTAQPIPATRPVAPGIVPGPLEAVQIDQTTYPKRPGYDPLFLKGGSSLRVPLPGLENVKSKILFFTVKGKKVSELRYWTYSVVMHKARKLALFAAANVDPTQRPTNDERKGDKWFLDTRIDESKQLGQDWYGEQREFEADRSRNPFDRGHLVRRLDARWGTTTDLAVRNGNDSFHFTNCSPQHWKFNQGSTRWLGLEDYVIQRFAGGDRACVINGPVFDAPLSAESGGGRIVPRPDGPRHRDPTFGGIGIPKLFFKIVACRRADGRLGAAAFLMSQEDLLGGVDRIKGMPALPLERLTDAQAKLYQVPVADVEAMTGLDFGSLAAADTGALEALGISEPQLIEEFGDIRA